MKPDSQGSQETRTESRTEIVGVRVTRMEKDAIDLVVKVRRPEGGVGELLRERSVQDVIDEGQRLLERLAKEAV